MELETSKKILLAIDGSEISWNTARVAIQLANVLSAEILGLYVVEEEMVVNDYADYQKELGIEGGPLSRTEKAELYENRGQEVLQRLKSLCHQSGVRVLVEIGLGGVGEMLQEQTREEYILAVGRRGNGHSDSHDYLGKNFRFIAHRATSPLLVGGDSVKPLKKILLAYNGARRTKKALDWVKYLQYEGLVETIALIVQEDDDFSIRAWENDIESEFCQNGINNYRIIIRQGNAAERIAGTAMKNGADLIIMGGYRHSAVLEWLETRCNVIKPI